MGVPLRVLEDLTAFNDALFHRFRFKTLALFATTRETERATAFVKTEFPFIDELSGPEILAVTLEEPRGGYWRYLRGSGERPAPDSIHALLDEANRSASTKKSLMPRVVFPFHIMLIE